jgi:ABC-type transport system involved in multi-copper enzyme maturation permease subunit
VPIYDQSYRVYEGELNPRFAWWVMVKQELRVLRKTRTFFWLVMLAALHAGLRLLHVVACDILASSPDSPIAKALRDLPALSVNEEMFLDFLLLQAPLVLLISIYAGSGMICNDFRNNLMEVYFSKPLSWFDYTLGKIMTLTLMGLALTALPGILLVVVHNLMAPGWETLRETLWLPVYITAFSLLLVLPCALGVLASSSLFNSQRYAGIAVFMVLFCDISIGTSLAESLDDKNLLVIALPFAIDRVGSRLFHLEKAGFDLPWGWSVLLIAVVCLAALAIVCRKTRRAEVAM